MKGLMILALGAWGAAKLYKSVQQRRGAGDALAAGMSRSAAARDGGFPAADASSWPSEATPASTETSLNAAERLQRTQAGGAFSGVAGGGATPRMFPEAERQEGDEPRPGLPDFARGA